MDQLDKLIISALDHGPKQQKELIELLDRARNTITNHVEYLIDENYVEKQTDGGNVFYELTDKKYDETIQPKPWADPEEVDSILRPMHSAFCEGRSPGERPNINDSLLEAVDDFESYVQDHYFVLKNETNLEKYTELLDYFLADMTTLDEHTVSTVPDRIYYNLLLATDGLLDNWKQHKEHEDVYSVLTERREKMVRAIKTCPVDCEHLLQSIVERINAKDGKRAFQMRVKKGACSEETLLTDAFYIYDARHDLDELLTDLDKIAQEFESQEARAEAERIQDLQTEVKDLYTREADQIYERVTEDSSW